MYKYAVEKNTNVYKILFIVRRFSVKENTLIKYIFHSGKAYSNYVQMFYFHKYLIIRDFAQMKKM